jgi:hypothetical protein
MKKSFAVKGNRCLCDLLIERDGLPSSLGEFWSCCTFTRFESLISLKLQLGSLFNCAICQDVCLNCLEVQHQSFFDCHDQVVFELFEGAALKLFQIAVSRCFELNVCRGTDQINETKLSEMGCQKPPHYA